MKAPKHGFAMGVGSQYGDQVRFKCDQGYVLQGETHITCLASGEWSSITPTCQREFDSSPALVTVLLFHEVFAIF